MLWKMQKLQNLVSVQRQQLSRHHRWQRHQQQ